MRLQIDEALFINRNLRPKDDAQTIEIEMVDDGMLLLSYNDGSISLYLYLEQLRAILRLFDTAEDES